jgi:hypothetical protein
MKRDAKVPLFLIILYCLAHGATPVRSALARPLAWPAGPSPQGCTQNWMTPAYSTYTSVTASTDATTIYTQVTVSGTTTGTCPAGCNQCHALHTGSAYNYVGGVGGWYNGSAVAWNSWLDTVNNQEITATPGTEYTFTSSTQVVCSVAGLIYQVVDLPEYLSIAETTVQTVQDNGAGVCKTSSDCTGGVSPRCPVSPVTDGMPCAPGFYCLSLSYRFSTSSPFTCLPPALCVHTATLPGACTQ